VLAVILIGSVGVILILVVALYGLLVSPRD
jgi:hypothetical protein